MTSKSALPKIYEAMLHTEEKKRHSQLQENRGNKFYEMNW